MLGLGRRMNQQSDRRMKLLTLSTAVILISTLSLAAEKRSEPQNRVLDVTFSLLSTKRGIIEDRDLPVSDWTVKLTNHSKESRWVRTVAASYTSKYLLERNPKKISYRVLVREAKNWKDSYMGYSMIVGNRDSWLEIGPSASVQFVVPIFDQFEQMPADIRFEFDIASEEKERTRRLVTKIYTHGAAGDKEPLQGLWQAVSLEANGQKAPVKEVKEFQLHFKGDKVVFLPTTQDREHRYDIEPMAKPKAMDITPGDGEKTGERLRCAIYDLTGDALIICMDRMGRHGNRPTEFKTEAGDEFVLITLERVKQTE